MKTKDPRSTESPKVTLELSESEDARFVARLQACADRVGSVNALAKKAGLSQGGVRKYFHGSEPTRLVLIALAQAAGVNVRWLATGEGPMLEAELGRTGRYLAEQPEGGVVATLLHDLQRSQQRVIPELLGTVLGAVESVFGDQLSPTERAELALRAHTVLYALARDEDAAQSLTKEDAEAIVRVVRKIG